MKVKNWKKVLAIVLTLALSIGSFGLWNPLKIVAAESVLFESQADVTSVQRGDTVSYSINMSENETGAGLDLIFEYDSSVLELQKVTEGVVFENIKNTTVNDTTPGIIHIIILSDEALKNGNVMTAEFKVSDSAKGNINGGKITQSDLCQSDADATMVETEMKNLSETLSINIPITGIHLNKNQLSLNKGQMEALTASIEPEDAQGDITWRSGDTSVAMVDKNGKVSAVGAGTTTITASIGSFTAECEVTVQIPLESITITGKTSTLNKGQTLPLSVSYNPEDTTDEKTVTWSSSDSKVASVDANGKVTAISEGTASITAKVGNVSAQYEVTVKEIKLTGISMKSELTIHEGDTDSLEVSYEPENTTDSKTVTWKSSNESVAAVDENGTVQAVKAGTAQITATVGNYSAVCEVTVDAPLKAIVPEKDSIELLKNQTATISYQLNPTDTTDDRNVTFSSSDESVAVVDDQGVVTAKKEGTAVITLKGANQVKATVEVLVKEIPISQILLSSQNQTLEVGEQAILTASILPENNTDENQTIRWSSSDSSVVSVTADATDSTKALIHAQTGGTATITATAWNGTTAVCTVKVPTHVQSVEADTSITILKGEEQAIKVNVVPEQNDDTVTFSWTTEDAKIATVDAKTGVVTGLKEGTTKVTTTAKMDGREEKLTSVTSVTVIENHLSEEIAERIVFEENASVIKGQTIALADYINLDEVIRDNQITDGIEIVWASEDSDILEVAVNGTAYAKKAGIAKVSAALYATDGNGDTKLYTVFGTCSVEEIPLESIVFDKEIKEMNVGTTDTLSVIYQPENTTDDRTVTWTSSDDTVLAVENGKLSALKAGTATITAAVGEREVSCEILVKEVPQKETETTGNNSQTTTTANNSQTTTSGNNSQSTTTANNNQTTTTANGTQNNEVSTNSTQTSVAQSGTDAQASNTQETANATTTAVKTGDSFSLFLYIALLLFAFGGIIVICARKKYRK